MTSHYAHIEAQAHRAAAEGIVEAGGRGGIVNGYFPVVPRGAVFLVTRSSPPKQHNRPLRSGV